MLNEVCEQFGYSRKHAIKLLGAKAGWGADHTVRKGRPSVYGAEVEVVLHRIWKAAEQPCGKRMAELRELWLPGYERRYGKLEAEPLRKVLGISAAQIDRLLARRKVREGKGRCGTKPGGLLKTQIPIRTDNWEVDRPGYLEADTVAHCGGSLEGDFVWSVTYTDIASGWTAILEYDFQDGGVYVTGLADLSIAQGPSDLRFKVKSDQPATVGVRLVDKTGQAHQNTYEYTETGEWQEFRFDLAEKAGMTFGGAGDKQIHFPITQIRLFVQKKRDGGAGTIRFRDVTFQ